jgi:BirA family biotin operon repressor/biotin-[acetyl-CoA-carboxylase] ligase
MTPRDVWSLDTLRLGRRVLVFDRLDSTNSFAASLADDPANDGVAVLADEQIAGRGQHGRAWAAPPRSAVLLSLLLFPPPELRRPALLTAWAAVAVCWTVRETAGLPARIKWPNDVLLRGRKVCGILIEQGRGVVVGVGLNVRQTDADFAAAGLPQAVSLASFAAPPPDPADVARKLLRRLDEDYDLLRGGDRATLEACWKWHLGLLGRTVRAECPEGPHEGRLSEVAFDGVVLERPGGALTLPPERILHLELI